MREASNGFCEHLPLFVMNGWNRTVWLILIVVLPLLLAGCTSWIYDVGIGLLDTTTQSMTLLRSGDYREVVVNILEQDRSFQTFQRVGNQLQMRTITFDGKVLSKPTIPLLFDGYAGKYQYAVSPDGSQIIYFNFSTRELRSYDIAAKNDSKLMERVVSAGGSVAKIHFISREEIILILIADAAAGGNGNAIVQFNIVTKIARTIAEPIYIFPCLDASFSRSNRYLAYWEASKKHSIYGDIRILDLKTSQVVGTIKNPGDALMANPSWSPNEQMVACVAGNSLLTAPLSGEPAKVVKVLPEDLTCYSLAFLDDKTLLYRTGKGGPRYALTSLDIDTGKEIGYSKRAFSGDILVVENGKRLICELGY
jgi:hypothetical protein